jgi:hypothetical protein
MLWRRFDIDQLAVDGHRRTVLGATWNRPLRLTDNWRAITAGVPAVVTKIVVSPVFAESTLEVDVWPPARPCAAARLATVREDVQQNPVWSGVTIASETLLPRGR